jgi:hypothetical protein
MTTISHRTRGQGKVFPSQRPEISISTFQKWKMKKYWKGGGGGGGDRKREGGSKKLDEKLMTFVHILIVPKAQERKNSLKTKR